MNDPKVLLAIAFLGLAAGVAHGLHLINRWLATGKVS